MPYIEVRAHGYKCDNPNCTNEVVVDDEITRGKSHIPEGWLVTETRSVYKEIFIRIHYVACSIGCNEIAFKSALLSKIEKIDAE